MQTVTRTEWGVRMVDLEGREQVLDYDDQQEAWENVAFWSAAGSAGVTLVSRTVTATSWTPGPKSLFPVPGARVSCGNRRDLPKAQRVHDWVPLGPDMRNCGERGFLELQVSACRECGADKATEGS